MQMITLSHPSSIAQGCPVCGCRKFCCHEDTLNWEQIERCQLNSAQQHPLTVTCNICGTSFVFEREAQIQPHEAQH